MAVSSTLNLDRVLDRILEQVDRVIPCDATNIMLVESGRARVVRWRGYERFGAEEFVSQVVFPITEVPNLQHMVETGEPMFITDTATYPGWVRVPVQAWLRSYAAAPIHVRDQVVGFLNVDSATPGHFSTADVQILRVFAAHAAAAIENAQLYQDVRDYAEQLEQRVAERTAQLSERMAEVERLNRTLTNLLEDLQAANRNLEEITEELQKANDELEAFAYSVSHDLRAPLRAMQGFAEALLEDYGNSLDAVGQEYAQRIVVAAQRMDALIQDLLAYSRLGRAEIRLQPLSLDQVVDEVLTQLEARIREQEAQVTVEKPLPEVLGHHTTMVQVVSNLLTNALKFVTPGVRPEVRIWAEEQPVGAASQGPSAAQRSAARVRLWVEDNGIGIAPEHQERIFRVFERLHGIETYPGTGIGLAIVRRAMEHMGGRVGVESEVGHGSRFWVELDKA
ncbi:MAG TPA: GAF domain-containing protein [Anaerolineae bacterium]|nr:GAF domain-containing protein [Anaerolineae bacterium]HIQ05458.1 GAF domain-containing protein [Anaerolineae bacterium]